MSVFSLSSFSLERRNWKKKVKKRKTTKGKRKRKRKQQHHIDIDSNVYLGRLVVYSYSFYCLDKTTPYNNKKEQFIENKRFEILITTTHCFVRKYQKFITNTFSSITISQGTKKLSCLSKKKKKKKKKEVSWIWQTVASDGEAPVLKFWWI